jgi:hypothetical protein
VRVKMVKTDKGAQRHFIKGRTSSLHSWRPCTFALSLADICTVLYIKNERSVTPINIQSTHFSIISISLFGITTRHSAEWA